jgi:hypothetical protein
MKKIFFFASALIASLSISAEVITLDLTQPTNPEQFTFAETGMWTETYNESDYEYFDTQVFSFSHLPSKKSYGGTSWEGFTVSKATQDGQGYGYYSNMAKGGINGMGTPYVFAYYSEFWLVSEDNEDMMSSNHIIFNDGKEYYPRYVYLNNAVIGHHDVVEGSAYGRAFTKGDRFEVWIQGLDKDYEATDEKVIYRLADYTSENPEEWFVNTEWAKVDLSPLGKVAGLTFTVVSTDQGNYGTNTATYFALDGLTVSTTADEPLPVAYAVATFENEEGGVNIAKADTCWQGADAPVPGWNNWKSGDYYFRTYFDNTYGAYYSSFTVTNETATTSTGYMEPYRSISGGAYEGSNFAVVYVDPWNPDTVSFEAQTVKGFFVNNTPYTVGAITTNNFAPASQFKLSDYLKLNCIGLKNKAVVNTVTVDLAIDGKYIGEWTYVDLSELGEIDAITFTMEGSDIGDYGLNTPSYFAMDNFGAAKPAGYVAPDMKEFDVATAISNTNADVNVVKVIRNGQVLIFRDGKAYNVLGAEL